MADTPPIETDMIVRLTSSSPSSPRNSTSEDSSTTIDTQELLAPEERQRLCARSKVDETCSTNKGNSGTGPRYPNGSVILLLGAAAAAASSAAAAASHGAPSPGPSGGEYHPFHELSSSTLTPNATTDIAPVRPNAYDRAVNNMGTKCAERDEEGANDIDLNDDSDDDDLIILSRNPSTGDDHAALRENTTRSTAAAAQRAARRSGRLTDQLCEDIVVTRRAVSSLTGTRSDYRFEENMIMVMVGAISQFDVRYPGGVASKMLPSSAADCCQTFSVLAAVLLASCGCSANLNAVWTTSTVNYLVYIAAWLHHCTAPLWGTNRTRPLIADLRAHLHIESFFPAHPSADFVNIYYNEAQRCREMIRALCVPPPPRCRRQGGSKRPRSSSSSSAIHVEDDEGHRHACTEGGSGEEDVAWTTCGYVIVSGEYTVSIVCVPMRAGWGREEHNHHHGGASSAVGGGSDGWTLLLCDSHGTLPWSRRKATITGVAASPGPHRPDAPVRTDRNGAKVFDVETAVDHFSNILFALLENNRRGSDQEAPFDAVHAAALERSGAGVECLDNNSGGLLLRTMRGLRRLTRFGTDAPSNETSAFGGGADVSPMSPRGDPAPQQRIPFMTWTPIFRNAAASPMACDALVQHIDGAWLPEIFSNPVCEAALLEATGSKALRPCFIGVASPPPPPPQGGTTPPQS